MPAFLLGVVALLLLLWAASAFIKADPKEAARVLRWIGGVAALLLAGFLLFRGQIGVAVPLGALGLGLLGWTSFWPTPFGARTQRSTGQVSRVRTAFLEMELDHYGNGEELAARVRTRHRLVVDVLLAMGVPVEAAEADAEGIEHHVSETTLKAFARFLHSRT
jgi:hypothetical protein